MRPSPFTTTVVAWLVPGAGHYLVGQTRKAAIFFGVLSAMFELAGPLSAFACSGWTRWT